MYIYTHYKM